MDQDAIFNNLNLLSVHNRFSILKIAHVYSNKSHADFWVIFSTPIGRFSSENIHFKQASTYSGGLTSIF